MVTGAAAIPDFPRAIGSPASNPRPSAKFAALRSDFPRISRINADC
jgi:hypothetical protein